MASGEVHFAVGVGIQQAAEGNPAGLPVAIVLAASSHWMLDDLNIGDVARLDHGLGSGWNKVAYLAVRAAMIVALIALAVMHPIYLVCGLVAWLCLDWEWGAGALLGRHGLGLHRRMWPAWLKRGQGRAIWAMITAIMVVWIWE